MVVVHTPVTPFGNPVATAPVAPVVLYVMFVIGKLIQALCASVPGADVLVIVLLGVTVITPVCVNVPQPPDEVIVYVNVPDCIGVPLIVNTLSVILFVVVVVHTPTTPLGNPVATAPVAPVVLYVIGVKDVLIQITCASVLGADVLVIVLLGVTVITPVCVNVPQPPDEVIVYVNVPV